VLARFDSAMANADLAQSRAAVAEAEAMLAEAAANAQRARELQASGALSAQQVAQLLTAERTAQARLEAVKAAQQVQQLRLQQAQVLAPDSGVISARSATVGAVVPAGTELFRLIRQGRLEWRGEVAATELAQIRRGQTGHAGRHRRRRARHRHGAPGGAHGRRGHAQRAGLRGPARHRRQRLKAGMFARGEFATGSSTALTLPQTAVLLRDGFSYVFRLGADNRVWPSSRWPPAAAARAHRDPAGPGREGPRRGQRRWLPGRRRHRARGGRAAGAHGRRQDHRRSKPPHEAPP
jgi:HlyD family secretion protein